MGGLALRLVIKVGCSMSFWSLFFIWTPVSISTLTALKGEAIVNLSYPSNNNFIYIMIPTSVASFSRDNNTIPSMVLELINSAHLALPQLNGIRRLNATQALFTQSLKFMFVDLFTIAEAHHRFNGLAALWVWHPTDRTVVYRRVCIKPAARSRHSENLMRLPSGHSCQFVSA